jgi:tetratricopeptide (TPR) repeat protein
MKKFGWAILCYALIINGLAAQSLKTTNGNKKASVSEYIGITKVTINYSRPGVKGREGKIWGQLVPYGYNNLGFGTSQNAPWRAGADEATTMEFSTDVKIEGKTLAAGKYGFYIALNAPDGADATLIFSKVNTDWGSYFYDPKEDALRVNVKTVKLSESTEWLKYSFLEQTDNAAVVALIWEKLKIPMRIEVDLHGSQLASFRHELRTEPGFQWQNWVQAASYCAQNNINLEEALTWADYAISGVFVGQKNFQTLSTKATVLTKLGRTAEADKLMKEALPLGSETDVHQYARQLLREKKAVEALSVFKMNYEKHPNTFTTNMGMMRAHSAVGEYAKALDFAQKALAQAPDPGNKMNLENSIKKLKENKDAN